MSLSLPSLRGISWRKGTGSLLGKVTRGAGGWRLEGVT